MNLAPLGLIVAAILAMPLVAQAQAKPAKPAGGSPTDKAPAQPAAPPKPDAKPDAKPETKPDSKSDSKSEDDERCQIDPSLCIKVDYKKEAERPLSEEIYTVQQIYALRRGRFEVNPYWSLTLNDQFVSHPGPGLALNYYITNGLALGANFNYYRNLNQDSEFNAQTRRAARIAVPLTEYDYSAALNATIVPFYGKFAGFGDFIFHYDTYVVLGGGILSNKPIAVIDPDNRTFSSKINPSGNVGVGLRIFFNRWFTAVLEVRDYIFMDKLENTTIAKNPKDSNTWYGDSKLTNHVQAQLGVSVFLPFSWEYKLPK